MKRQLTFVTAAAQVLCLLAVITRQGHTQSQPPGRPTTIFRAEDYIDRLTGHPISKSAEIALRRVIRANRERSYPDTLAALQQLRRAMGLPPGAASQQPGWADSDATREAVLRELQDAMGLYAELSRRRLLRADTIEDKQAAVEQLRDALSSEFDADMQRRVEELDNIKRRVAQLEAAFQRRDAAKVKVIELRLQLRIEGADGPQ